MTKIKFCGLSRAEDIIAANELNVDYVGFVFAPKSKRFINRPKARELKSKLKPPIKAVGVFVNESINNIKSMLDENIIDMVQLHGDEGDEYIAALKKITDNPIIKAFVIKCAADVIRAKGSKADKILLDAGAGVGNVFDWSLIKDVKRDYFLAGGLTAQNVGTAIKALAPYALDVSSGIETGGKKDGEKMKDFVATVKNTDIVISKGQYL